MTLREQIRDEVHDLLDTLAAVSDDPAIRADFTSRCNALLIAVRNALEQHMPAVIEDDGGPTDGDMNGTVDHG